VATALLCVLVAITGRIWLLGLVALAAFGELISGVRQNRLARRLATTGCDPKNIQKALLASWKRLGLVSPETSPLATKKAKNAQLQLTFLRPFLSGRVETPKMSVLQILGALGLYLGLFVFFVILLALAVGSGMMESTDRFNRGVAYHDEGKYDLAISEFTKAIEINPTYAEAYCNRGAAYHENGLYDQAISDYSKALEINPRDHMAYKNRGSAYYETHKYELAISDYTKAIEINPRDDIVYNDRGNAFSALGKIEQAISDYNKAIEINPASGMAYSNRALAYFLEARYSKAWDDVHKAQSLGFEVPQELLNSLRQASGRQE
jgi:tetratricopeptide (TPR) repeat protein